MQCYHQKKQKRNQMIFEVILQLLNDVSTLNLHQKYEKVEFLMTSLRNKTYVKKNPFLACKSRIYKQFCFEKKNEKMF